MRIAERLNYTGALLLLLAAAFALVFFNFKGTADTDVWGRWIAQTQEKGIIKGYKSAVSDYPPLTFVALTVTAKAAPRLGLSERAGFKLSLYLALLSTALFFLAYSRNLILAALVLLSLVVDSMAMGYLDVYLAPLLILAFWALSKDRLWLFTTLYCTACLIKWQPLVLGPFILLYVLGMSRLRDFRMIPWQKLLLQALVPAAAIATAMLVIFGTPVVDALQRGLSDPFLSAQALNFNWVFNYLLNLLAPSTYGGLVDGKVHPAMAGDGFLSFLTIPLFWGLMLAILVRWFLAAKTYRSLLLYLLLGYATYYMFGTSAHENHFFLGVVLAAMLAFVDNRYRTVFYLCALVLNVNIIVFYGLDGRALPFSRVIGGFDTSVPLAVINVMLYFALFAHIMFGREKEEESAPDMRLKEEAATGA